MSSSADDNDATADELLQKCEANLSEVAESGHFDKPQHRKWLEQQPEFTWMAEQEITLP